MPYFIVASQRNFDSIGPARGERRGSLLSFLGSFWENCMSLLSAVDLPDVELLKIWNLGRQESKRAGASLAGLLQGLKSGHLFLSVPTPLIRGIYDSLAEPGITLPYRGAEEALRTGIVVMSPKEVEKVGGLSAIKERGQQFRYYLGEIVETPAYGHVGVSRCWRMKVSSPELKTLRYSYGLPDKIDGKHGFSIEIAHRRSGVLGKNDISRSADTSDLGKERTWENLLD